MRISVWSSVVCSSDLGREVGIVDAVAGGCAHLVLAVIGDAEAGGAQQVEVIGAVADRAGVEGNRALRGGQFLQRLQLGGAAEHRVGHLAGDAAVGNFQAIGARLVEAAGGAHALGRAEERQAGKESVNPFVYSCVAFQYKKTIKK